MQRASRHGHMSGARPSAVALICQSHHAQQLGIERQRPGVLASHVPL